MSSQAQQQSVQDTPIEDAVFTVLDLETTGGAPPEHKITEIAAFRIEKLAIAGEFTSLINPERPIPAFITGLTGINQKMINGSPASREVLPDLMEFMGESVLVAHHSQFDRSFLDNELKLAGFPPVSNADLCTSRLARRILPWLPSKSLGNLAQFFGISLKNHHRAAGDTLATCKLLLLFLDYLQHRGINTVPELLLFQYGDFDYQN